MSKIVLPNSINYNDQLPSLMPNVNNYTQVLQPTNSKSTYSDNDQIIIDIPSRGMIDPKSIYFRYKNTVTRGGAGDASILGCPVYAPILRVDTFFGSQLQDTVSDYNLVAHMWSNTNLGVSEKYGSQASFGYNDTTPSTVTLDELDGRAITATETFFVSAPLVCTMLSGCEKMIPSFATGGLRLVFTLDTAANILITSAGNSYAISNFELVYDMIDFGPEIEQSVLSMENIIIKSNSYSASSVPVNSGTSGSTTLVYNQRFASIRNALVLPTGSATANTVNKKFDAIDITSGGSYQLNIGGQVYPQGGPISMALNKSGALSELRKAVGSLYDWSKSFAINSIEFGYVANPLPTTGLTQPGKVYIGFDCNKINSASNMMLNGTSSQNSPINLNLNFGSPTLTNNYNVFLVLNYDAILNIDPRTKQIRVLQ